MRIVSIVGARPQFVKLASLSRRLRASGHDEKILHTGQHYDPAMSETFFAELGIPTPHVHLNVGSASHARQTALMLEGIESFLVKNPPDAVIIFGDTNSTLAGALASAKLRIPCVHVEAGLRSFNRSMPEELNRVVADHTSDLLLVPTLTGMRNLEREGLSDRARLTGDIMVDTLVEQRERAATTSTVLARLALEGQPYTLVTLHRPYNVDDPTYTPGLLKSLAALGDRVVFPMHPRTKAVLDRASSEIPKEVLVCEPLGYHDFIQLQANARRVVTDSGGVQKESYLLGVPCITVRPETEWRETVESGWNMLADPRAPEFQEQIRQFNPAGPRPPVYGHNVAVQMVAALEQLGPAFE
jgi:UDP-N-acetylglucosamine 2-epimerase